MARHFTNWRDQTAVPVRLPGSSLGFVLRRATQYLSLATESPLTARELEVLHLVSEGKRDLELR